MTLRRRLLVALLAAGNVAMAGCLGASGPEQTVDVGSPTEPPVHEDALDDKGNESSVVTDVMAGRVQGLDCTGAWVTMPWLREGFPYTPPSGYPESELPGASLDLWVARCVRVVVGEQVFTDVSLLYESHTNVSPHADPSFEGRYARLAAPVTFVSNNVALSESVASAWAVPVGVGNFSFASAPGTLSVSVDVGESALLIEAAGHHQGRAESSEQVTRIVLRASPLAWMSVHEWRHGEHFAMAGSATASGGFFGTAEHPASLDGQVAGQVVDLDEADFIWEPNGDGSL